MYWWCSKCGVSAGNGVIQNITYRFSGVLSVGFTKVLSVRFASNVNLVTFFSKWCSKCMSDTIHILHIKKKHETNKKQSQCQHQNIWVSEHATWTIPIIQPQDLTVRKLREPHDRFAAARAVILSSVECRWFMWCLVAEDTLVCVYIYT